MRDHLVRLRVGRSWLAVAAVVGATVVAGFAPGGLGVGATATQDPTTTSSEVVTTVATTAAPTTETTSTPETTGSTQAPATTDPRGPATTSGAADVQPAGPAQATEDDDEVNWPLVAAVAAAALLLLALLATLLAASRRRARERQVLRRRMAEVVGRAQWVHDEGSLEVLGATASPERLQAVWSDARRRINDVASQASSLAARTADEATDHRLRNLSYALGRLLGALDTHASLHLQLSGDPSIRTALDGATETVMERRTDLATAIRPLAAQI